MGRGLPRWLENIEIEGLNLKFTARELYNACCCESKQELQSVRKWLYVNLKPVSEKKGYNLPEKEYLLKDFLKVLEQRCLK